MVQGTINGVGERCGNANLVSILPALQLKLGYQCVSPERLRTLTETAHFVDEICNLAPDPDQPYVGRNAFAHKGGMHVAGVEADARTFEHLDPELVGNSRDVLISELSGKGSVLNRAERSGIALDPDAAKRAVERVKEREHLGYHYEAADASFDLMLRREAGSYLPLFRLESFRVITEKRADGKVETEATIKIWVDERRYVRTAEGNGPVNALDKALRAAITDLHPHLADIELVNYKVRILDENLGTGAVTRVLLDSSDGHAEWGTIGVSENIIEASWEALVESLEFAFQPNNHLRRPPRPSPQRVTPQQIPLARPDLGAREEELVLDVLRSGRLSLGPSLDRFERDFAAWLGVEDAVAVSSGTAGLHLGVRALGWGAGDEVVTTPFSFVASANCLLYEGATPVFCDIDPVTLNLDPDAARAAVGRQTSGLLPVDILGYPAATPSFGEIAAGSGLGLLQDACEALGAVDSDGVRVGAQGLPGDLRLLRQQAADDGGGRDRGARRPRLGREASQRAQPGTGARHGPGRARPGRLQLPAHRPAGGDRDRPAGARRRPLGRARPSRRRLHAAAGPKRGGAGRGGRSRRAWCCPARTAAPSGGAGSSTPCSSRSAPTAARSSPIWPSAAIQSKAYMPCIHLLGPYRERFGHREGEFPVAEAASDRLLALPFFTGMSDDEVERVCEALDEALQGNWT